MFGRNQRNGRCMNKRNSQNRQRMRLRDGSCQNQNSENQFGRGIRQGKGQNR